MLAHISAAGDGIEIGEENGEHRAHLIGNSRNTRGLAACQQALDQTAGLALQVFIEARRTQSRERFQPGTHGQRITRERARLINRAIR